MLAHSPLFSLLLIGVSLAFNCNHFQKGNLSEKKAAM
jgi:hypothetical protein